MKSREAVWGTWTCGALVLRKPLGTCQYFFLNNFINFSLRILSIGLRRQAALCYGVARQEADPNCKVLNALATHPRKLSGLTYSRLRRFALPSSSEKPIHLSLIDAGGTCCPQRVGHTCGLSLIDAGGTRCPQRVGHTCGFAAKYICLWRSGCHGPAAAGRSTLSVRTDPKTTRRLLHTTQQPPDSAECNSSLLRAACHVRQLAADDRNILPARTLRFCAYENASNL